MAKRPSLSAPLVKSLFAYSGNQCAMHDCQNKLVDESGTILGKIAHICSASPGGARYDGKMQDAERHGATNLFIICGPCHDIIDDKNNEKTYPASLLRKYKKQHENRFKKAERQLIKRFVDTTQIDQPTYPKSLNAYAMVFGITDEDQLRTEVDEFRYFIDRLKELPPTERQFALELATRMVRRGVEELDVHDAMSAFKVGQTALKRHMTIIADHGLGHISERPNNDSHAIELSEKWLHVLCFCEQNDIAPTEILIALNFGLLD